MAKSDEEKVQTALSKEVEEETPVEAGETAPEQTPSDNPEATVEETPTVPPEDDEDKPPESTASTFTKPEGYEWVKGDNLEEFNKNLLVAYENSTAEALRLRQAAPAPAAASDETPASVPLDPAVAYAQSMMQRDMVDSFNDFAKKYPQAREPQSFDQFEKASNGASQAFAAAYGRIPTYPELFEKTASLLGWQSSGKTAQKDAAIKDAAASTATTSQAQAPSKPVKLNAKTIEIARRIPGNQDKSDSELVKELQPFIT